jgi:signal peptidase II
MPLLKKSQKLTLLLAFSFFVFDYLFKWLAKNFLSYPIVIFEGFSLRYEENTGIAWSIPIPHLILIPLNLILLTGIIYYGLTRFDLRNNMTKFALAMIIGGALGNIYDRISYGYVIDFISVGRWPIFNLADAFLVTGVFILFIFYGKIKGSSK